MFYPDFQYALFSHGTAMPDWQQPQRPIRVPWPGQPSAFRVDAHQWVKDILEQWQLAAAISLVVALPAAGAADEHRTIISTPDDGQAAADCGDARRPEGQGRGVPGGSRTAPQDAPRRS